MFLAFDNGNHVFCALLPLRHTTGRPVYRARVASGGRVIYQGRGKTGACAWLMCGDWETVVL